MFSKSFLKFNVITAALSAVVGTAFAQSNIDNTVPNKHAWGENVGWTNWRGEAEPGQGVRVDSFVMSGFIWGENVGWINVGDGTPASPPFYGNANGTDFGVNIDPDGDLHGYGWGENIGWINFDGGAMATPAQPAKIECSAGAGELARLNGFAWGENVGWINLSVLEDTKFVAVDAATTPIACDMNHDGVDNGRDVGLFISHLLNGTGDWRDICSGDVEAAPDHVINLDDISAFVTCLLTK